MSLRRRVAAARPFRAKRPSGYVLSPTCQIPNLAFLYELVFGLRDDGLFVEIGGYDGYTYSNTSALADRGWSGIFVEPVPEFAALCRERYRRNRSVEVAAVAIGATQGRLKIHVGGPYSTSRDEVVDECRNLAYAEHAFDELKVVDVDVVTLDSFLTERHVSRGFELLVVDVEGQEPEVFAGFGLANWQPQMLIVELTDAHPTVTVNRRRHAELGRSIRSSGYGTLFKDTSNTVFVREDVLEKVYRDGRPRDSAR